MSHSKRFFAFGCSFTASHDRPTWADIIGLEFDQYQNWARGGMGNQYIFNSLIEANQRNKFNSDDLVIIMWSSITREDRYVDHEWLGKGNIFWSDVFDNSWKKKYADERFYLIRDLATIKATKELLDHWGVTYYFLSMIPIQTTETSMLFDEDNKDVIDLYGDVLVSIRPSIYEIVFNNRSWTEKPSSFGAWIDEKKTVRDSHPDPTEALEYLNKVLPEIKLSTKTTDYVNNFKLGDPAPEFYGMERL